VIHAQPTGQRPNLYPGRSGNMADPNQAGMPNRLMMKSGWPGDRKVPHRTR
jgi:hypothetical protein